MVIGKRVAELRKRRGLSQAKLAELVGVKAGTVAGWELDRHGVRMGHLEKLAAALGVPVRRLFR